MLPMDHDTRAPQAVSRLGRKRGRKLANMKQRLFQTERTESNRETVIFLGPTLLLLQEW
jgi:hypothetical protein